MEWSTDGQTPEFLAATRMASLSDSVVQEILSFTPLSAGMRVLDVGCGSGEYCFRLGSRVAGVDFIGVDLDWEFVDFANARVAGEVGYPFEIPNSQNKYDFVAGNGLALPFDDAEFDAVISHTYLTAVPEWDDALAEMCRVCKSGGLVSSVTSLTDNFYGTGSFDFLADDYPQEDTALVARVRELKSRVLWQMNTVAGIPPRRAPEAFRNAGIRNVRCRALGHYFCLSDAQLDSGEYQRHVDLLYANERTEIERLEKSEGADALPSGQWARYSELVEERREHLLSMAGNNCEWNWYGNSSLLVVGVA